MLSSDGLPTGALSWMLEDREGNVWVASNLGIFRFAPSRELALSSLPTWPADRLIPGGPFVTSETGELWIAHQRNEVYHYEGHAFQRMDTLLNANAALRTRAGAIWFGGQEGLWRMEGSHVVEHVPRPASVARTDIQSLAEDATGAIWASVVHEGVFRISGGLWSYRGGVAGLPEAPALILASDAAHRMWLGYADGRAALVDGGRVNIYSKADGLDIGPVTAVEGRRQRLVGRTTWSRAVAGKTIQPSRSRDRRRLS